MSDIMQEENRDADWKTIVENAYMGLIKGSLNRIAVFGHDTILNNLVRLLVNVSEGSKKENQKADEILISTDKFYIFKNMWKPILEILYEKYLPSVNYQFVWTIEATPYTLAICDLTKNNADNLELLHFMSLTGITEKEIEMILV